MTNYADNPNDIIKSLTRGALQVTVEYGTGRTYTKTFTDQEATDRYFAKLSDVMRQQRMAAGGTDEDDD